MSASVQTLFINYQPVFSNFKNLIFKITEIDTKLFSLAKTAFNGALSPTRWHYQSEV